MIAGFKERLPVPAERTLNRLIIWMGILLVLSVGGFAAYYIYDRQPGTARNPLDGEIAQYEQQARLNPAEVGPRLGLADLYFTSGKFAASVEQYQAALALDEKV